MSSTSPNRVNLRVFATLRRYTNGAESVDVEIEDGATIADALARAGIPASEAKIIFVDGRKGSLESRVSDGNSVGVFPAIGGG